MIQKSALAAVSAAGLLGLAALVPGSAEAVSSDPLELAITAKAEHVGPGADVEVRVNGDVVGRLVVENDEYEVHTVRLSHPLDREDKVDLVFVNDAQPGEPDRNVAFREISSAGHRLPVVSAGAAYDRGYGYAQSTDGREVLPAQELLPWNGALRLRWDAAAQESFVEESKIERIVSSATRSVSATAASPSTTAKSITPTATATSSKSGLPVAASSSAPAAQPAPSTAPSSSAVGTPSAGADTRVQPLAAAPGATGSQPFGAASFWNKQVPADAPLHPNSAGFVGTLVENLKLQGKASINTTAYAPPIYVVDGSTPRTKVSNWLCNGASDDPAWLAKNWGAQFDSVPVPPDVAPSAGSDGEIVIWSPSTGELWEMWRFEKTDAGFRACWGGKINDTANASGAFPYPFGVTASGLSLLGGTVRVSELQAGEINHAIAIGVNAPRKGVMSWPANRTDGTSDSPNAIAEGQRFRLDPAVDVDSLKISPIAKVIAKASQKYGMIVRDNTGGPLVVYAEDSTPYTRAGKSNPYTELYGAVQYDWMVGFPWDKMQALPMDYGKP